MEKKITGIIVFLALFILFPHSTFAESKNQTFSMKTLVCEAWQDLQSVFYHHSLSLSVDIPEDITASTNREKAKKKVLDLLAIATSRAAPGTHIKAEFNNSGQKFLVWVQNNATSSRVKEEIVDTLGNSFTIEFFPGSGILYTTTLDH